MGYSNTGDGMIGNAARDFMASMDKVCALMKNKELAADIKYIAERMNLINSVIKGGGLTQLLPIFLFFSSNRLRQ